MLFYFFDRSPEERLVKARGIRCTVNIFVNRREMLNLDTIDSSYP